MSLITSLLDFFLVKETSRRFSAPRCLGWGLLFFAGGIGIFFLFQFLALKIGYLESGGIICVIAASMGAGLLYYERKRSARSIEGYFNQAQEIVKKAEMNLDQVIKTHPSKVLLGAFMIGLSLYQLKNLKIRK